MDVQPFICSQRYQDETLRLIVRPHTGPVGSGILLIRDNAVRRQFLQDEAVDIMCVNKVFR